MLIKSLQCILSFLALVAAVHGRIAPIAECTAQAWVRAPDLAPNAIVQGDARVKISAECPAIDNVSLGLRFKERSFVKALRSREDATQLRPGHASFDFSNGSPWPSPFVDEELLTNKNLWIIREEESAVFETAQPFSIGVEHHGALRDAVQNFVILVPSTNFPPALQRMVIGVSREREILEAEWIYEYFVQISFSNGTTKDISAGYTAFQPQHDPASAIQWPSSATVELRGIVSRKYAENAPIADYSIEITGDSGLTFFAGATSQFVNAVVKRTGLARKFPAPLNVSVCIMPVLSSKWAAEYGMSDDHVYPRPPAEFALRDKKGASRRRRPLCSSHNRIVVMMPNSSSDEIQANEVVTTTSATLTIPVELQDTHITDFETYYQVLANALTITLIVPRGDEDVDPDDPHGEHDAHYGTKLFEDDEEAWVPWEKQAFMMKRSYSGRVPVVVHPAEVTLPQRCLPARMAMLDQVIFSDDTSCKRPSLTHYLVEGARGPTFLDRSAVHAILAEDPAQRALRAPILKPVFSSPPNGEERVYRYYTTNPRFPIYVGETWAKKVADKDKVVSVDVSDGPVLDYVEPPVHA